MAVDRETPAAIPVPPGGADPVRPAGPGPSSLPVVPPAMAGPLVLGAFRARRLDPALVAGIPGGPVAELALELGRSAVTLDDRPALHVHEQVAGPHRVRGVVGLLDLRPLRPVTGDRRGASLLPHEAVDPVRVRRLVAHLVELGLDPAAVVLVSDPTYEGAEEGPEPGLAAILDDLTARAPDHDHVDGRGARHRLWTVVDPAAQRRLARAAGEHRLLLADGHHRFVAHLDLLARTPTVGDGRMLAMVVDGRHDAPTTLPVHRVVRGIGMTLLERAFASHGHSVASSQDPAASGHLAPADLPAGRELRLVSQARSSRVRLGGADHRSVVELADAVLHEVVPAARPWRYHHDAASALEEVAASAAVAVLLPPTPSPSVWDAALEGRPLPAKATSFQPKPPVGVLFRSWHDAAPDPA